MPAEPIPRASSAPAMRFGVAELLWFTVSVAIVSAVAGRFLRGLSGERQLALAMFWICAIGYAFLWRYYVTWRESRVPAAAGAVRFVFVSRWRPHARLRLLQFNVLAAVSIVATLWTYSWMIVEDRDPRFSQLVMYCILAGMYLAGMTIAYFGRQIALCDAGTVVNRRLSLWNVYRGGKWLPKNVCWLERTFGLFEVVDAFEVPLQMQPAVEDFLREKMRFLESPRATQNKSLTAPQSPDLDKSSARESC